MRADLVTRTADRLHVTVDRNEAEGGKSGSGIYHAVRTDGTACVLKITARTDDDACAGRRELDFYRELSGQVPVRTPTLLEYLEDDESVALLLTAHGTIDPPTAWDATSWEMLAVDLARLHRTRIPAAEQWVPTSSAGHALHHADVGLLDGFWRQDFLGFQGGLDAILDRRALLEQDIARGGVAFLHGDCHTDNLLRTGNSLVWIDWQSATVGSCAHEMAFVQARATPSGVTVPPQMLAIYCRERGISYASMERAVLAAELSIFIFQWPPHAAYDTPAETRRVRSRARHLANLWAAGARC